MRFQAKDIMIVRLGAQATMAMAIAAMLAMAAHAESLYDPDNPALPYLQSPADAFGALPPNDLGNRVDWTAALKDGLIQPWARFSPDQRDEDAEEPAGLDLDVVMSNTGDLPPVTFSHASHTALLDCESCHPALVQPLRAANRHPMVAMVEGESCGLCHGTVAFPLADCAACHRPPEAR